MNLEKFLEFANRLKSVKRTGWVERGVKGPESVADHSFMMALMCMVLPAKGIDREKAVKMALAHDLAESVTGDIITKENWPEKGTMHAKEKAVLEREAMNKILSNLDASDAREIKELWEEFEEGKSREASFVNDIDMAEVLIQAYGYHKSGNFKKPLEGFWDSTNTGKIRDENIRVLVRNIINGS